MESWAGAQEGACAPAFQNLLEGGLRGAGEGGAARWQPGDRAVPWSGD